MTIIFIENLFGSGQIVTVAETFRKQTFERTLRPGDNGRFLISPFKSIVVSESIILANSDDALNCAAPGLKYGSYSLIEMTMRSNDD
jgi:hypothetical protein